MVRQEGESISSPEERTAAFFDRTLSQIANDLVKDRMIIELPSSDKRVRIYEIEEWPRYKVGPRYKKAGIEDMNPGDLWNPPIRAIRQSLIVTKDRERVGACIRILQVNYWDPEKGEFVPTLTQEGYTFAAREGDISRYFGLEKNERSKLSFLDDSETLYIVRGIYTEENPERQGISPEDANRELERFLGSNS